MVATRVRRRRRAGGRWFWFLASAGALASLACAGEEPSATERYCDAHCDRLRSCDRGWDSCAADCSREVDYEPFRTDAVDDLSSCVRGQSCSSVGSEAAFSACWDDMLSRVRATEYGRRFCRTYASYLFSCGYSYSAEECEADYGIFTDEALERLLPCTEWPCENRSYCEEQQLWVSE